jgi:hypothetical protein
MLLQLYFGAEVYGRIGLRAIAEVIAFDLGDPRRSSILRLLANWKISIEITGQVDTEEELMVTLSQAYLEWEQQTEQRGLQQGLERGLERGLEQERSLIFRLLTRRVGQLDSGLEQLVQNLSLSKLEDLGEALLDFASVADLRDWLRSQGIPDDESILGG